MQSFPSTPERIPIDAIAPTLAVIAAWREATNAGPCDCDPMLCPHAKECFGGGGSYPFPPDSLKEDNDENQTVR